MLGVVTTQHWGCPARTPQGERTRGDAAAAHGGDGRLPRRARLGRHDHDRRQPSAPVSSRGAQLHHFPSKQDLVVAAVEHLTERRRDEMRASRRRPARGAAHARGARHPVDAVHLAGVLRRAGAVGRGPHGRGVARSRSGRWSAASAARRTRTRVELLGVDESRGDNRPARAGHPRPAARPRPRRLAHRRQQAPRRRPRRLGRPSSSDELEIALMTRRPRHRPGRPRRRERSARLVGRRRSTPTTGRPSRRPRAGPSPTRSRTCTGPTRRRSRRSPTPSAFDERLKLAAAEPDRLRRRRHRARWRWSRRRAAGRLARGPRRARRGAARRARTARRSRGSARR